MSAVGVVGSLMAGNGPEDILNFTFAGVSGVPKVLPCKKFPDNLGVLRLLME